MVSGRTTPVRAPCERTVSIRVSSMSSPVGQSRVRMSIPVSRSQARSSNGAGLARRRSRVRVPLLPLDTCFDRKAESFRIAFALQDRVRSAALGVLLGRSGHRWSISFPPDPDWLRSLQQLKSPSGIDSKLGLWEPGQDSRAATTGEAKSLWLRGSSTCAL